MVAQPVKLPKSQQEVEFDKMMRSQKSNDSVLGSSGMRLLKQMAKQVRLHRFFKIGFQEKTGGKYFSVHKVA